MESPASGEVALSLSQETDGEVSGFVTFSGIACLSTAAFRGTVTDALLEGTATQDDVVVRFDVNASDAERGAQSSLAGSFSIEAGTGCTLPFRAVFSATPEGG